MAGNNYLKQVLGSYLATKISCKFTFISEIEALIEGRSLADLVEMGIDQMINDSLMNSYVSRRIIMDNNLLLLHELLPPIPCEFEENFYHEKFSNSNFSSGERSHAIEQLVSTNIDLVFTILRCFYDYIREHSLYPYAVFLKMLYFASDERLLEFLNFDFVQFVNRFLTERCEMVERICLKAVIIVTERFPEYSRHNLLSIRKIYHLRRMKEYCPMAEIFYEKYELERVLSKKVRRWDDSKEVCRRFSNYDDVAKASRMLADVMKNRSFEALDFVQFDFVRCLHSFIGQSLNSGDEASIKLFLESILDFSWKSQEEYHYDSRVFKMLVASAKKSLEHVDWAWPTISTNMCQNCSSPNHTMPFFNVHLEQMALLLEYLHTLNNTWNRWFDIFSALPLIENGEFQCIETIVLPSRRKVAITEEKVALHKILITKCPVIYPLETRRNIFETDIPSDHGAAVPIFLKRENLIDQFMELSWNWKPFHFQKRWSICFEDEIGEGVGLEREFYSLISKEFQRHDLQMWLGSHESHSENPNSVSKQSFNGLFPNWATTNNQDRFYLLGQLMARALLKKRLLDIPLSIEFFKRLIPGCYYKHTKKHFDVAMVMPESAKFIEQLVTVQRKVSFIRSDPTIPKREKMKMIGNLKFDNSCSFEELCVWFTVPGTNEQLKEGGSDDMLSPFKVDEYLRLLGEKVLSSDNCLNFEAFRMGLNFVFPLHNLSVFTPEELKSIICGQQQEIWSVTYLQQCCKYQNGYDSNSEQIQFLFKVLSSLKEKERRMFLQFVGGVPKLPNGGLRELQPPLTISRVTRECGSSDLMLPTSSTCFNLLHLPEYSSLETMREKLLFSISEGSRCFHLK